MAKLHIYEYGEPILRKKCREVKKITSGLLKTLDKMSETMYAAQGIGLAAPQIGLDERFIVVDVGEGLWKLINPKIISRRGKGISTEGCLSLPGISVQVKRADEVTVEALNEKGKKIVVKGKDLFSEALQHEIDHLNGILLVDYLDKHNKKQAEKTLKQWVEKSPKG